MSSTFEEIDKSILSDITATKGFKYSGKAVLLTYKSHITKDELVKLFLTITSKVKTIRICWETGKADIHTPYEHTHALITFAQEYQTTCARRFDFNGIHPNVYKVWMTKHGKHLQNTIAYLGKEDPKGSDLLYGEDEIKNSSLVERVFSCDTLQEALLNEVDKPSDALGIKTLFENKPKPTFCVLTTLYPWQDALCNELKHHPDDRKIIWFVDERGGSGKTQLCKHLQSSSKDYYCVNQAGGAYHFATIIGSALDSGWTGHCIFFNLSRSAETHSIYEPIEMVKDGIITELKFRGKTSLFPCPWVVVFANWYPNVHKLSLDRWDIRVPVILSDNNNGKQESLTGKRILNIKLGYAQISVDECIARRTAMSHVTLL